MLGRLTQVRAIQLNDAHIFCTADQVRRRGPRRPGADRRGPRRWGSSRCATGCRCRAPPGSTWRFPGCGSARGDAARRCSTGCRTRPSREAAFYGPKIDVQIADSLGRESTLSTVQIDLYQPSRFDLEYTGPDEAKHRPVMVHRSIVGSVEQAVAHLIEVHGGAFPAWLAPVQVAVLPLGEDAVGVRRLGGPALYRSRAAGGGGGAGEGQPGGADPGGAAGAVPADRRYPRGGGRGSVSVRLRGRAANPALWASRKRWGGSAGSPRDGRASCGD